MKRTQEGEELPHASKTELVVLSHRAEAGAGDCVYRVREAFTIAEVAFNLYPQEKRVDVWDQPYIETEDGIFHKHCYCIDFFLQFCISLNNVIGV